MYPVSRYLWERAKKAKEQGVAPIHEFSKIQQHLTAQIYNNLYWTEDKIKKEFYNYYNGVSDSQNFFKKPLETLKEVNISLYNKLNNGYCVQKIKATLLLAGGKNLKMGNNTLFASALKVSRDLGCSERNVWYAINELQQEGWLNKIKTGNSFQRKANVYMLTSKAIDWIIKATNGFYGIFKQVLPVYKGDSNIQKNMYKVNLGIVLGLDSQEDKVVSYQYLLSMLKIRMHLTETEATEYIKNNFNLA